MKRTLFLVITLVIGYLNSACQDPAEVFIRDVDQNVKNLMASVTEVYLSEKSKTKVAVNGEIGTSMRYKYKIKYTRQGMKKENIEIVYRGPSRPLHMLEIIRINDEYFYIHRTTYSFNEGERKLYEEELVERKVYKKIEYTENGKRVNRTIFLKLHKE